MDIKSTIDLERIEASAAEAAALLKLLGNRHRLLVLCMLSDGELAVGQLQERLGLSQSALSQHLARLRGDGLVETRRAAQTIHYRIADPVVLRLIATLADIFCPTEPGRSE